MLRRLRLLLLPMLAVALFFAATGSNAVAAEAPDSPTAEQYEWQLLDLINRDRAAAGAPPLKMATVLVDYARFHARDMRTQGTIWHDMEEFKSWAPSGWTGLAENVAYNSSITSMHSAYMNSSGHRANILNPNYTHIGIGIMISGSRIYNSEDFMRHSGTGITLATPPGMNPPPAADTTAPGVALTGPAAGATVNGTVSVTATASDNVGVSKVEFYVDGRLRSGDTSSPYAYSWDTRGVTDGSHTLTVKAYDAAGNISPNSARSVTVRNATAADTTAPSAATGLRSVTTSSRYAVFEWTAAADNIGVTGYRVYAGSTQLGTTTGTGFADFSVASGTSRNYTVRAYDAAGNVGPASAPLSVTAP